MEMETDGEEEDLRNTPPVVPAGKKRKILCESGQDGVIKVEPESDFEAAISATGYGKFHILLMVFSFTAFWAACAVTAAPSFIFAQAQCDMNLSLLDMGTVVAMTYGGMLASGLLWGYLSDTLGRKQIMVWGYLVSGLVEIVCSMTQNFPMLLVTKFISGVMFTGPSTVVISYIAELHPTEMRARVMLLTSLFYTSGSVTVPVLAWAMLTNRWDFYFFGNKIVIHAWNLFLLATALVPLITGLSFAFLPESPKFLMSRGRNEEAMDAFKRIFVMNTGKPAEEYPIKSLVVEKSEKQASGMAALRGGLEQLLPLFKPPHLKWLLLICILHAGVMFGTNTIRLWYPQLAAMISSNEGQGLCAAIAPTAAPDVGVDCVPLQPDLLTYLQSAMVGAGALLTFVIGGVIVNKCGKKVVTGTCGLVSGGLVLLVPVVGSSAAAVTVLMASVLAFSSLAGATLSAVCVDLFPTSLRVMALATFLMSGRIGTIIGSMVFPALIDFGCLPPFFTISAVLAVCGIASYLLPNTTLKKLE